MEPGPATAAVRPSEYVATSLATVGEAERRKVLHDNAAVLYRVR
jgi:predicted TIM-barrel fold metal-dependent hydrolase